jgi:hypothetical protein
MTSETWARTVEATTMKTDLRAAISPDQSEDSTKWFGGGHSKSGSDDD